DLVVEALEPPLPLPHDLRLERPLPVAGRLDAHLTVLGDQRLRCRPVPGVAGPSRRLLMRLVAEVVGQLDLERPLDQPLGQLRQQPARAGDLLLRPRAGKQLVEQLVRQQRLQLLSELGSPSRAPAATASLRSPYGLAPLR